MDIAVSAAVADSIRATPHPLTVLWHGGEPLVTGSDHFRALLQPFSEGRRRGDIRHSLQTNGTLLNPAWCDLLSEEAFQVGVSIDGPSSFNSSRVAWSGAPSATAALKGIDLLKERQIPFGTIAVLNRAHLAPNAADVLFDFFCSLGCHSVSINVEEREGLNRDASDLPYERVVAFWRRLLLRWIDAPVVRFRELDHVLGWLQAVGGTAIPIAPHVRDLWPTVACSGDVVVLSPEFAAARPDELVRFVVGNVLATPLPTIARASLGRSYVRSFQRGVEACQRTCSYYSYCGGGQASNKYYEHGKVEATETAHCRNARQAVVDAALSVFESSREG